MLRLLCWLAVAFSCAMVLWDAISQVLVLR